MKSDEHSPKSKAEQFFSKENQEQLKTIFASLTNPITLCLFTSKGDDQREVQIARDLILAFQDVSLKKIQFKEYDISDSDAKKWGIHRTPTIAFSPERYNIHYLGVPLGEEGRTMVETMMLIGMGKSRLSSQSINIANSLDGRRDLKVFVSSSCPYCPQQAVNAVKAAIHRPDLVHLEIVDINFNNDLAEKYAAYSVPQTFANENLIGKGAQPEELFMSSLDALEEQTYFIPHSDAELVESDLVIVGAGPAGLTAGIYAARSGLNAVIVEKGNPGGQVALTPVVENYPGLVHVGGKNLVDIMVTHALQYVKMFPRESVMEIKPGDPIEVVTTLRRHKTRAVLLATGASYRPLGADGEKEFTGRGVSYCSTCDGPLFTGKKVLIVGGGNSAVTEALHLKHVGVDVTIVHRRDSFRAQEHLVEEIKTNRIPVLWNTEVREIKGREKVEQAVLYNNLTGQTETMKIDGVFVAIGYDPEVSLAKKLGLEITEDGYIKQDGRHRTNYRGIYSAGDVEGGYKQIVTAAGAGAAAAMTIFEDLTHPYWEDEKRYQG